MLRMIGKDIDYTPDWEYHRIAWKIKRIAWICMLLIIVAATMGLLGLGPLSKKVAVSTSGKLEVFYHNLLRSNKPVRFHFNFHTETSDSIYVFSLNEDFLKDVSVKTIVPSPIRSEINGDVLNYFFRLSHPGKKMRVSFQFQPEEFGNKLLRVHAMNERETLDLTLFIYP